MNRTAVFDRIVEVSLGRGQGADDPPAYAGRLLDAGAEYPDVMRFRACYQLERGDAASRASVAAAMKDKVAAVRAAQRRGTVTDRFTADQASIRANGCSASSA